MSSTANHVAVLARIQSYPVRPCSPRFKRLHLTRASVRRASGFVLTGYAEVMRRRTLDRWVVFGQRDVKLSISRLVGSQFRSLLIPIHQRSNRVLFPSVHGSWRFIMTLVKLR